MTIESCIKKAKSKSDEPPYNNMEDVGFGDEFRCKVEEFKTLAQVVKDAEAERKKLAKEIQGMLAEKGKDRVLIPNWEDGKDAKVLAFEGHTSWIAKELLLENGVSMNTIEKSMKSTTYVQVGVYPVDSSS